MIIRANVKLSMSLMNHNLGSKYTVLFGLFDRLYSAGNRFVWPCRHVVSSSNNHSSTNKHTYYADLDQIKIAG